MQRRGGRVLAISVDAPADSNAVVAKSKLPFSILSDEERRVVRAFGVIHERGGPRRESIAIPSMFLIDKSGRVVWQRVARRVVDRPEPQDVIAAIRAHLGA